MAFASKRLSRCGHTGAIKVPCTSLRQDPRTCPNIRHAADRIQCGKRDTISPQAWGRLMHSIWSQPGPGLWPHPTYLFQAPSSITIAARDKVALLAITITALNGFLRYGQFELLRSRIQPSRLVVRCLPPRHISSGSATATLTVSTTAPHAVSGPATVSRRTPSGWLGGSWLDRGRNC
jgi:hypothetical protein